MTNELSRYGTGPDDLSEAEPERIVVTDEMRQARQSIDVYAFSNSSDYHDAIYRAMYSAPKDNGWEPTLHSADFVNRLADARDAMEVERDAARDVVKDMAFILARNDELLDFSVVTHDALLTRYNELFAAHEALLQRLADLEPKPEVKPDPFRPHADDRRKMGWVP